MTLVCDVIGSFCAEVWKSSFDVGDANMFYVEGCSHLIYLLCRYSSLPFVIQWQCMSSTFGFGALGGCIFS